MSKKENKVQFPKALILCGGLGTRLKSIIGRTPKSLAPLKQKTFLDFQLGWLFKRGFENITLLTGYKSEEIKNYLENNIINKNNRLKITIVKEDKQLGTGGAILNYLQKTENKSSFVVLNGDTYSDLNFNDFLNFCYEDNKITIASTFSKNCFRYGSLSILKENYLQGFNEKSILRKTGWINAGVYYFPKNIYSEFNLQREEFSLENDFFPYLLSQNKVIKVFKTKCEFIDIGTPVSLQFFKKHYTI